MSVAVAVSKGTAEWFFDVWAECLLRRVRHVDEGRSRPTHAYRGKKRLKLPKYEPHPIGGDGSPYAPAGSRGVYQPANDPHQAAFIVIQVERCLKRHAEKTGTGMLAWNFAFHYWAEKRTLESFKDANLEIEHGPMSGYAKRKLRNSLVDELRYQIGQRPPETISEAAIEEVRKRYRL